VRFNGHLRGKYQPRLCKKAAALLLQQQPKLEKEYNICYNNTTDVLRAGPLRRGTPLKSGRDLGEECGALTDDTFGDFRKFIFVWDSWDTWWNERNIH
jgi:hypothetical protein